MSGVFYRRGLNRGADIEGGGAADLQADVMRFMAILAICLVVIFALVQSIPLAPRPPDVPVEPVAAVPPPEPAAEPQPQPVAEPMPQPVVEPEPVAETEPAVETAAPTPAPVEPPPSPAAEEGFTLRFESDLALTRLVARNVIGFYAIGGDRSLRMHTSEGRISFWEASTPNQYHEMERATVPADVIRALLRTNDVDATSIRWGVTLPAGMQRDLAGYLETASGGALVILANGKLRLEP